MHRLFSLGFALSVLLSGCSPRSDRALDGTGSTFIAPLMDKWKERYKGEHQVKMTYEGVGSGTGVQRLTSGLFDFACSDSPLDDGQLVEARKARGEVVHIPLTLSAVVAAYNLPEAKDPLILSGPVLADVYLGKIRRWNDPAIQALNPGVSLPDREVVVVHRGDNSGTTYIWTDYLAKVSDDWKGRVGVGASVTWPTGSGEMGNKAVVQKIKSTADSLGYLPLTYAMQGGLSSARVKNREGVVVQADAAAVSSAAEACLAHVPDDLRYSLTDAPGAGSYPVCGTTWAVVFVELPKEKGRALVDFLRWATHDGQADAEVLNYVRLPASIVERLDKKLDQIGGQW
jgi:phosphate ABC transporter phosphate-binding protein